MAVKKSVLDFIGNGYYNDIIIDEGYHPSFDIHYTYGGSGGQIVYHEFTMIMSVYDSNGDLRILGTTTTRWSGNSVTSYRISDETLTGIYSALNTYAPNATDININYILESFSDSNYQNSLGTSSLEGYGYFSQLGSSPTFTNFSYEDINSTTLALTGNNQKIIKGYSNVRYTIDNSNKAVARSGGNIVSYEFKKNNGSEVVNTISYPITKTYNAYNENDLQVKATDSRGFYKIVAKGNNTIDYYLPSGTLTAQREGATTKGKLDFSGTYWSGNFGTGNNTIVEAFFRVKPKNGSWGNWFQISSQDISLNNGSVYIETATTAYGVSLTVGTEYEVEFKITDGISSSKTFNTVTGIKGTISNGNVLDSYYKTSSGDYKVGINKLVDVNGTELQVSGRMMVKPKQDQYSCILIESSNRNEASIQYTNQAGDKGYVAGYGTAGFDGFGIYSHGSGQNILGVNGTRDSNNNPVNTIKLINGIDTINADGSMKVPNGFLSMTQGNVGTPTGGGYLILKRTNNSEAPNNGIVLEFGNSTSWVGQLFLGDNADQGIYWNGWSNGVRGSWRKFPFKDTIKDMFVVETKEKYTGALASGSNATLTIDISKTDYKPIGLVGYYCTGTRSSYINVYAQYLDGTNAKVIIKNTHPSNALANNDTKVIVYVLYVSNY